MQSDWLNMPKRYSALLSCSARYGILIAANALHRLNPFLPQTTYHSIIELFIMHDGEGCAWNGRKSRQVNSDRALDYQRRRKSEDHPERESCGIEKPLGRVPGSGQMIQLHGVVVLLENGKLSNSREPCT